MLKKAGLLGDDGKPKGLDGAANFDAALAKLTTKESPAFRFRTTAARVADLLHAAQSAGWPVPQRRQVPRRRQPEKATTALAEMQKWVKSGATPANTEYPASIALFTSGKAAMHINGVWEVPTMVDLAKKGQLFDWGAIQIPAFFAHPATWADSHSFAIPDRKRQSGRPAKRKLVLETVHWFNEHSLEWAGGGHIPAFLPVQDSAEFKALKPNSDYSSLAKTAVFDPVSTLRRRRFARLRRGGQLHDPSAERRDRAGRRGQENPRRSSERRPNRPGDAPAPAGFDRCRPAGRGARFARAMLRSKRSEYMTAAVLMAPFVVIYGVLFVYPTIKMAQLSLHRRAADWAREVGRLRQLLPACLRPAVFDRGLEHRSISSSCRSFPSTLAGARGGARG